MGDDFIGARKILGSELKLDLRRCEAEKKRNMKWNGTPGLLYGLSLCCNVEGEVCQGNVHEQRRIQTTKSASEYRAEEEEM